MQNFADNMLILCHIATRNDGEASIAAHACQTGDAARGGERPRLDGVVIELLCEAGRYSGAWPPVQVLSGDRIPITPSGSFADLRIVTIWLMAVDLFIQAHDISHTTGSDFGAWVSLSPHELHKSACFAPSRTHFERPLTCYQ
jgi:hypothetical protein